MWVYLLKFSGCLLVLLLFYKVALEKVTIHHFKRYYLLAAFIIALGIPFVTFTQYVTTASPPIAHSFVASTIIPPQTTPMERNNFLSLLLWGIYGLGVVAFSIKFLINLKKIISSIRNNPTHRAGKLLHVLLQEEVTPHTFFNFLFFNLRNYKSNKIPQEIFWHEEAHAQQKHSLDILVLELLQIVFWFHPLVYWAKHLVKLNHEFLADQAVLHKGAIMPSYQNLVLAFSSNAIAPSLANPIHYSSIKKRIVIMNTHTSQKAIWLRSLLLLPLLALLLYSFSTKEFVEIEKTAERTTLSEHQNVKPPSTEINNVSIFQSIKKPEITILINRNGQLLMEGDLVKIDHLKSHLRNYNQHLTKEERSQLVRAIIRVDKDTPSSTIKKVASILMDYGVATVDIRERFEQQEKATKKEVKEYNELAKKYNARPKNQQLIKEKDVQRMEYIYNRMSDTQKRNAQPFPNFPPPPPKAPKTPKTPKAKLDSKIPPPPPPAPAPPTPKVNEDRKSNIPPPPPPTKNPNQGNYSNILIESYKKFNNKANTYAQAVGAYKREGEGTLLNLQTLYEETMVLYDDYVELAKKEGLLSPTKATPKDHE